MSHVDDFPPLQLDVRPPPPRAWSDIVQRARRRRDRAVAGAAALLAVGAAVPAFALAGHGDNTSLPAHHPSRTYSDLCDTAYDKPAPPGDTIDHALLLGGVLLSPPGANKPSVSGDEIRRRAAARGMTMSPGTQVRYALVRAVINGHVRRRPEVRWVLTACGQPEPRVVPGPNRTLKQAGTMLVDRLELLTDSGAGEAQYAGLSSFAACDTRLNVTAPASTRVQSAFHVGEASVEPPRSGESLPGRDRVRSALRNRFPGTQIRLGRVRPLHTPGVSRLRWIVTTCGLDGSSVRPALPGVVNEVLVYDTRGRLLGEHRSGARSEAEAVLPKLPPVPFPAPTHKAASPNMCSEWSHAYPDFRQRAAAAGYTDMQGCYLQALAVVIFVTQPGGHGAAALYRAANGKEYDATYQARFPYERFTFFPAPVGDTVRLVKLLSPHVAEVELSGPGVAPVRWKFDAETSTFLPCTDTTSTRAPCSG
ncbi:MAG: hypothetical protein QOI82_15 [Actinomycetota bacterium]|jgi:hypothetical protein|nr:hypothetical protein [Actinomycetota bacterium]